jgi:hypothetical protein
VKLQLGLVSSAHSIFRCWSQGLLTPSVLALSQIHTSVSSWILPQRAKLVLSQDWVSSQHSDQIRTYQTTLVQLRQFSASTRMSVKVKLYCLLQLLLRQSLLRNVIMEFQKHSNIHYLHKPISKFLHVVHYTMFRLASSKKLNHEFLPKAEKRLSSFNHSIQQNWHIFVWDCLKWI